MMYLEYLRISIRNIWKNRGLALINIIGLAIGMAITLLSLLYVTNELTYDRFHEHKDRIFRVINRTESPAEGSFTSSIFTAGVGPSFLAQIPDIQSMVRVSYPSGCFFRFDESNFAADRAVYADSSFFKMFSFPLLQGSPETALKDPYKVVLTKSFANTIFGKWEQSVGKVLLLDNKHKVRVSGVVDDPPVNSHLKFDVLLSFESLYRDPQMYLGWNGGWNYSTYLLLYNNSEIEKVEKQFVPIAWENINKEMAEIGNSWNYSLQPLSKVHLDDSLDWDIDTRGSRKQMLLFVAVTFVVLLIACINFINLTTAGALTRMKEVGIRKVAGAARRQIVAQFLTESLVIGSIALIHAIIFIELFYLWLSTRISDPAFLENFELYNRSFFQVAGMLVFLIFVVGFVAGAYPALLMSGFKPALAVKGKMHLGSGSPILRNVLVVFQFTIAIIFIVSTIVIATQLDYLLRTSKGFSTNGKLVVPLSSDKAKQNVHVLKESFLKLPGIESVGASSAIPGRGYTSNGYLPESGHEPLMFHALDVDYDYLEAMGLEVVQGRNFSKLYGQDEDAYLVNQALVRHLGWSDAVGKTLTRGTEHKIIGVVRDYNFSTLHVNIEPLVITLKPWRGYSYLTLSTSGIDPSLVDRLEESWKSVLPHDDFESFTLESYMVEAYGTERQFMHMLLFCAGLTIFIAALGLFGLAAFMTRRRFREIAVRKVFGAGMERIFALITTGFIKLVLLANLVAWPVAWFLMENYFLVNFAYSTHVKWWIFPVALGISCLIAVAVILVQVIRLAALNPVQYIRYE